MSPGSKVGDDDGVAVGLPVIIAPRLGGSVGAILGGIVVVTVMLSLNNPCCSSLRRGRP